MTTETKGAATAEAPGKQRMNSRRAGRERAFQVLYGLSLTSVAREEDLWRAFNECPWPDEDSPYEAPPAGCAPEGCVLVAPDPAELAPRLARNPEEGSEFAWELALGVWQNQKRLDEVIASFSRHWRVDRIARIELVILRLALYEMLYRTDIPVKVAINEAVELSKLFGDDNSRGFVNGILDAAAKAIHNDTLGIH